MIVCNTNDILKLDNKSIQDIRFEDIVCYVLVGGNPGGTEGCVYLFTLPYQELHVYRGNVFYGNDLDKENVYALLTEINGFFDRWEIPILTSGWMEIPYVMGHYVFVRDFMVEDLRRNWKSVDARNHYERLVKGVYETCKLFEEKLVIPIQKEKLEGYEVLSELIRLYPDIISNTLRLKALLNDLMPNESYIRKLIYVAAEECIPQKLQNMDSFDSVVVQRLSKEFADANECRYVLAEQVVVLWFCCLKTIDYDNRDSKWKFVKENANDD